MTIDIKGRASPYPFRYELVDDGFRNPDTKEVREFHVRLWDIKAILLGDEILELSLKDSSIQDEHGNKHRPLVETAIMPEKPFLSEGKYYLLTKFLGEEAAVKELGSAT